MLDIKTKGGDSISFCFVNKGGKGRELMLTRGKKKQKTGEREKNRKEGEKRNKEQDSRKHRNLEAKRKAKKGNRNIKNNSEIQKKKTDRY